MLCDGEATLVDRPFVNDSGSALASSAMIRAGAEHFLNAFDFPLWVGQDGLSGPYDLQRESRRLAEGKCAVKEIDFHSRLDSLDVCKVVLDFGSGQRTYWVDINRGAIPLRIEDSRGPKKTHISVQDDLRFIPNAGWLPFTQRLVMQDGKIVREIHITEAEVHLKPDVSEFQLDFPSAVKMYDDARKRKYLPRKTWSLLQLPSPNSPDAKPFTPKLSVPPPELPGGN